MDDKGMIRVLVYGTLKKGGSNHYLIEAAGGQFIGYDMVEGPYDMFDLGAIPAVVPAQDGKTRKVRGELYAITPEGLASLDMLEGHPNLYRRSKVWTEIHKRRAWMYQLVSDNFMLGIDDDDKRVAGLWKPSKDESRFWLDYAKTSKVA